MYCIKCGKFVPDGRNFCGHCGAKQETIPQVPVQPKPVQQPIPQYYAPQPAPKKQGLSKGAVIGIIAGASVFVLAFAVILLIGLSNTVGRVEALDPSTFFDQIPDVTFDEPEEYVFYFSDNLPVADAVLDYISILIDDYGMVIREQEVEEGSMVFELGKGDSPHKTVRIYCDRTGDSYQVIISIGKKVTLGGYDVYDWGESESASDVQEETVPQVQQEVPLTTPTPTPTPAPTPTPTPAPTYPILPDLYAFLGGNASPMDTSDYGEHVIEADYKLGMSDGWEAGQEYAQLLIDDPRFGLSLRAAYDVDRYSGPMKVYIFDYVGSGNVEQMSTRYYGTDYVYVDADVLVTVHRSGYGGYGSICVSYSEDFTMEDFGDRASFVPEGASGESIDFGGTNNDYSGRVDCPYCNRGDCDKCGGDGYVYSSASGKDDRNCPAAHCLNGRCSYCDGDGWVE